MLFDDKISRRALSGTGRSWCSPSDCRGCSMRHGSTTFHEPKERQRQAAQAERNGTPGSAGVAGVPRNRAGGRPRHATAGLLARRIGTLPPGVGRLFL
ncbi:MAG: hypothetical protein MZV64_10050 [Ignavibacteriales bacterium]|nr:hypothetical protein [Ignavibacteriales bacterium]